nr:MAG TPA: hypothetical protein [Caudoviricetes sp.]
MKLCRHNILFYLKTCIYCNNSILKMQNNIICDIM